MREWDIGCYNLYKCMNLTISSRILPITISRELNNQLGMLQRPLPSKIFIGRSGQFNLSTKSDTYHMESDIDKPPLQVIIHVTTTHKIIILIYTCIHATAV